jgi:hypothetical protein
MPYTMPPGLKKSKSDPIIDVELSASRSYSLSNSNHIFDHPEKGVVYLLYPFPLTIQKGGTP